MPTSRNDTAAFVKANASPLALGGRILEIRGKRVLLDGDLVKLYEIDTKRLSEQVKRNAERFPADFMSRLSPDEFSDLKSQFATSSWGGKRKPPNAFTEHGAIMRRLPKVKTFPEASTTEPTRRNPKSQDHT